MFDIRKEMPLLARHEGDWKGSYTMIDHEGNILDRYDSHISCQFPDDDSYPYYQINRYYWPDGKVEEHHFPARYQDKKIWFDTERINGYAWEVDDATIILRFIYKEVPNVYIYEMILLSLDNNHRARTWHLFKNNQLYQRCLIQEERVERV